MAVLQTPVGVILRRHPRILSVGIVPGPRQFSNLEIARERGLLEIRANDDVEIVADFIGPAPVRSGVTRLITATNVSSEMSKSPCRSSSIRCLAPMARFIRHRFTWSRGSCRAAMGLDWWPGPHNSKW